MKFSFPLLVTAGCMTILSCIEGSIREEFGTKEINVTQVNDEVNIGGLNVTQRDEVVNELMKMKLNLTQGVNELFTKQLNMTLGDGIADAKNTTAKKPDDHGKLKDLHGDGQKKRADKAKEEDKRLWQEFGDDMKNMALQIY